jgi:hypothetical protein
MARAGHVLLESPAVTAYHLARLEAASAGLAEVPVEATGSVDAIGRLVPLLVPAFLSAGSPTSQ